MPGRPVLCGEVNALMNQSTVSRSAYLYYVLVLGLLVVPMYVLRDVYPWWFLLGLALGIASVLLDAWRYHRRRRREGGRRARTTEIANGARRRSRAAVR
jgi:hypothetical protein